MTETLTLEAAAREHVQQRDRENAVQAAGQRAEERAREASSGVNYLTNLLAEQGLDDVAVNVAAKEWDGDDRIVLEVDGLRLQYHPRSYLGYDFGYSFEYVRLLRPCQGCGAGEAPVGGDIRSLYELGQAVDAPLPARCDGCWEEDSTTDAAPIPAVSPDQRLLEALRDFVDDRMPLLP